MARDTVHAARERTVSTPAVVPPTEAATMASPSKVVWAGARARARPSWAPYATHRQAALSSVALVATTPIVVLALKAGEGSGTIATGGSSPGPSTEP